MAKRYGIDPVELIDSNCTNMFLRLAYMRKIAEMGVEVENEQMEAHTKQMELNNKMRR